jgi:hypothetical protein
MDFLNIPVTPQVFNDLVYTTFLLSDGDNSLGFSIYYGHEHCCIAILNSLIDVDFALNITIILECPPINQA